MEVAKTEYPYGNTPEKVADLERRVVWLEQAVRELQAQPKPAQPNTAQKSYLHSDGTVHPYPEDL